MVDSISKLTSEEKEVILKDTLKVLKKYKLEKECKIYNQIVTSWTPGEEGKDDQRFQIVGEVGEKSKGLIKEVEKDLKKYIDKYEEFGIEIAVKLGAGDAVPKLEVTNGKGEKVDLRDVVKGKVVFLDLWAPWCGPCREPMQHNCTLVAKNQEKWGDKAAIVGLNVSSIKSGKDHIKKLDWKGVEFVHCPGDWQSPALATFQGSSIPLCFLIDVDGTIVKRGHPSEFKIVEDIDALLAGKKKDNEDEKKDDAPKKKKEEDKNPKNWKNLSKEQQDEVVETILEAKPKDIPGIMVLDVKGVNTEVWEGDNIEKDSFLLTVGGVGTRKLEVVQQVMVWLATVESLVPDMRRRVRLP